MTNATRMNSNYFPEYIYYGATEQEAELYESQFNISNRSNLSIENRFLADSFARDITTTQITQRAVLKDVQVLSQEFEHLKKAQAGFAEDIGRLARIEAALDHLSSVLNPEQKSQWQSEPAAIDPSAYGAPAVESQPPPSEEDSGPLLVPMVRTARMLVDPSPSESSPSPAAPPTDRDKGKSLKSSLKRRPLKLLADALVAHRRLQESNASHPIYVNPTSGRDADEKSYDTDTDDIADEDE
ncbi:hypothetical protein B0O80DRAFT_109451 [Mortierella sp. GBAus27b]|nr:hypothetical protein B0O80DRAFT_109451 [Mortierella sp. GBAus27b]